MCFVNLRNCLCDFREVNVKKTGNRTMITWVALLLALLFILPAPGALALEGDDSVLEEVSQEESSSQTEEDPSQSQEEPSQEESSQEESLLPEETGEDIILPSPISSPNLGKVEKNVSSTFPMRTCASSRSLAAFSTTGVIFDGVNTK